MNIDWNPVVHILDDLSEGTHSLMELSFMAPDYEQPAFPEGLLFLADRALVELSEGRNRSVAIPRTDWQQRLRQAFSDEAADPHILTSTSIALTTEGEQVLRRLKIGHPPFSGSGNGS